MIQCNSIIKLKSKKQQAIEIVLTYYQTCAFLKYYINIIFLQPKGTTYNNALPKVRAGHCNFGFSSLTIIGLV